jgi:hypothetical protein
VILFPAAAAAPAALPLSLALTLVLALLPLAAAVFAKTHGPEVVLAAATGRPAPTAELATAAPAGVALRAAVVAAAGAPVVERLDGELRQGAWGRDGAFEFRKGGSDQ